MGNINSSKITPDFKVSGELNIKIKCNLENLPPREEYMLRLIDNAIIIKDGLGMELEIPIEYLNKIHFYDDYNRIVFMNFGIKYLDFSLLNKDDKETIIMWYGLLSCEFRGLEDDSDDSDTIYTRSTESKTTRSRTNSVSSSVSNRNRINV